MHASADGYINVNVSIRITHEVRESTPHHTTVGLPLVYDSVTSEACRPK